MKTISMDIVELDVVVITPDRRTLYTSIDRERKSQPQHAAEPIPVRSWVDD